MQDINISDTDLQTETNLVTQIHRQRQSQISDLQTKIETDLGTNKETQTKTATNSWPYSIVDK